MSKETRILFIALLAGFLVLFVQQIVAHRDLVEEIRVGDGHVSSFVGKHNDMMMKR